MRCSVLPTVLRIVVDNNIPINDIPPCVLTELADTTDEELIALGEGKKRNIVRAILISLPSTLIITSKDNLTCCTKRAPTNWSVVANFIKPDNQSCESFQEKSIVVVDAV